MCVICICAICVNYICKTICPICVICICKTIKLYVSCVHVLYVSTICVICTCVIFDKDDTHSKTICVIL